MVHRLADPAIWQLLDIARGIYEAAGAQQPRHARGTFVAPCGSVSRDASSLLLSGLAALIPLWRPELASLTIVPLVAPDQLRLEFGPSVAAAPFLALLALVTPGVALWSLRRGAPSDGARLALFARRRCSPCCSRAAWPRSR